MRLNSLIVQVSFAVASATFFTSCGDLLEQAKEEAEKADYEATWTTGCISKENNNGEVETYNKVTRTITAEESTETNEEFEKTDTKCAGKALFTINATAKFDVGGELSTPTGAKEVDITPTKVTITLKTAEYVSMFAEYKLCGVSDWKIDTETDITTASCEDGEKMNDTIYDIFVVDGNKMTLGDKNGDKTGKTAALRPTTLSTKDDVFTKE